MHSGPLPISRVKENHLKPLPLTPGLNLWKQFAFHHARFHRMIRQKIMNPVTMQPCSTIERDCVWFLTKYLACETCIL